MSDVDVGLPAGQAPPVGPGPDAERQRRAREYAAIKHRLFFVDAGIGLLYLGIGLFSGASTWLARSLPGPWPLTLALFLLIAGGLYTLLTAPLTYYSGYLLPHRYGLSIQSLGAWLADQAKAGAIGLVLGLIVLELLYVLLGTLPDWWWLVAAGAMLFFTVGLATLAPVVLLPLFYKLTPLGDSELTRRLIALADRAGTRVRGVYQMNESSKSTTANAMLMGFGRTRRIVLTDTLIERYSPAEIEVVLAHELAHHVHRDMPKGMALSAVVTLAGFWVADRLLQAAVGPLGLTAKADLAGLPVLLFGLALVAFLLGPVTNAFSRVWEAAADRYALEMTRDPASFASMMLKLADQNLAELAPSRLVELFFYDHPPIAKRLAMGERFARESGVAQG